MNTSFPRINEEVKAILKQSKAEPTFEGTVLEGKEQKYAVIKLADLAKYNSEFDLNEVAPLIDSLLGNVEAGREKDGKKPFNSYVVINTDEPYIKDIVAILEANGHWDGQPVESKIKPLTFAKEDTSLDEGGWILERKSLQDIQDKLALTPYEADLETIEAIRLIIAGEDALLKKRMEELEDF